MVIYSSFLLLLFIFFIPSESIADREIEELEAIFIAHFDQELSADYPKQVTVQSHGGKVIPDGISGSALRLNADEYIYFAGKDFINSEQGTIMFWIKPHWGYYAAVNVKYPLSHTFVSFKWKSQSYFIISDGWNEFAGSPFTYFIADEKSKAHLREKIMYSENEWIHFTCVWKIGISGFVKLYKNGKLISENQKVYGRSTQSEGNIYIGSDKGTSEAHGRSANADIDEFMIFNKVLSENEINNVIKKQDNLWRQHFDGWADEILSKPYAPLKDNQGRIQEIRAIFDEGVGWATESGAHKTIQRIKKAGFNVYIPCIWHGEGARYPTDLISHDSRVRPGERDPLEQLIRIAHENEIEVHPWFTVALRRKDFLNEYHSFLYTPPKAFDLHRPEFRKFITSLILDVVKRYDIDGVNLDYIRTMGLCKCQYCVNEYKSRYGRDLLMDSLVKDNLYRMEPHLQQWQDNAVEEIVKQISVQGKRIKPDLIISVDGHPTPKILPPSWEGRREILWANAGIVDAVFNMDYYTEKPDIEKHELIRQELKHPEKLIMLLANCSVEKKDLFGRVKQLASRDQKLMVKLISYVQRRWPGGVGIYHYPKLNESQVNAFHQGPFKLKAVPSWAIHQGITKE